MNIALIGYGNMGQEIERLIQSSTNHKIVSVSYKNKKDKLDLKSIAKADVAIDFTSAEIVLENIKAVSGLGVDMVIGTTGWYDNLEAVKKIVEKSKIGFIYGQNFSIGANLFFQIVGFSTKLISKFPQYDVFGTETHHVGKKDSPSGTAKKLAGIIMQNNFQKKTLQTERLDRQIRADELHFTSTRGGHNFGEHTITFDSNADAIRLSHQAFGREGFAKGALMAAEFVKGKIGLFNFNDHFFSEGQVRK